MSQQTPRPDDRTQYGGQAVVEGVMMRSPRFFAIACRRQSTGELVLKLESVENTFRKLAWLNKPFLRGTLALVDAFLMGYRALVYSANVQVEDQIESGVSPTEAIREAEAAGALNLGMGEGAIWPPTPNPQTAPGTPIGTQSINGIAIGATTVIALLFGYALFWLLPAALTDFVIPHHAQVHSLARQFGTNLFEGLIRIVIFLGYLGLISQMAHVKRVFQYHGAEHKAINTLELGLPLTVENARASSRIHPRCGTNFIFIVLITAILVFSVIPRHTPSDGAALYLSSHLLRLLLLPVVAGISFEILKFAAKHREKAWGKAMVAPGLWTQYLTTRVPDDSQIEVALAALISVWDKEHERVSEPTSVVAASPLDAPEPASGLA